uniref:Uncharacterized protein n=1 Tax=Rhizophora mucronata TaxID=61149 RepID=A0A2P2LMN4_RHIMU
MTNLVTDNSIIWVHCKQFSSKTSMRRVTKTLIIYLHML